jgi:hypothetical protein
MENFDAVETAYQNEHAASRMLRDLIREAQTPPVATIEQIAATKRGSCAWDQHQVLSWKDRKHFMTAVDVTIEASHLTITEAQMYRDYLSAQGVLAAINP